MSVAVLVPSLNSPLIDVVLDAVEAQDGIERVREVLVIGRDEPGLLRERHMPGGGRVRLLDTQRPVSEPVARNLGLRAVRDELIVFLDSDCVPRPGWLRAHLAAHERLWRDGVNGLVSGSVAAVAESYWALVYNLSLFHAFLDVDRAGPRAALPTLNLSFRRESAGLVGPFDESLLRATDLDWTLRARRAGLALRFDPAPVVEHRHAPTRCVPSGATAPAPASTRAASACATPSWSPRRRSCAPRSRSARCRRSSRRG